MAFYSFTLFRKRLTYTVVYIAATIWFGAARQSWGWASFIELKDLKDYKKGYVVSDQCIIEAEVIVLYETSQKTLKC